jgi:phasin family protein
MNDVATKSEETKTVAPAAPAVVPAPAVAKAPTPTPAPAAEPVVAKVAKPVVAKPAKAVQPKSQPVAPAPKPVTKKPALVAKRKPAIVARRKPAATPPRTAPVRAATTAKDLTMDTMKKTTDKAQAMFSDVNDRAKGAMEKGQKMFDEMNSFSKGNLEAIVESSKIAAKGIESMGQDAAAYAKKSFEEATATAKTMASVKSPTEFMKLQSDYVRNAFDMMVAETSRSTEAMLKLAGEVAQPISNRVALAAEKVKIAA